MTMTMYVYSYCEVTAVIQLDTFIPCLFFIICVIYSFFFSLVAFHSFPLGFCSAMFFYLYLGPLGCI